VSGRKAIEKNKDLAFDVYRQMGGNTEGTLRELKKRGLSLTKKTFNDWRKKFRFDERLKEADLERQRAEDSQLSFEEKMMLKLLAQIEKYERYFDSKSGIDNQAVYAYTNLLKTVIELSRKMKPKKQKKDLAEMQREAREILEAEYGIKRKSK